MMPTDQIPPQNRRRKWLRPRTLGLGLGLGLLAGGAALWIVGSGPSLADQPAAKVDRAMVERGAYLAAAGDCVACHTAPGGKEFAGGRPLPTPFGTIFSANITSDPEKGVGAWSAEAFHRALTEGLSRDGSHIYPACPYPSFAIVSRRDSAAIQTYLLSRPAEATSPPANALSFPFSFRPLVGFWKLLFVAQPDAAERKLAEATGGVDRGRYLVDGLGHCAACHAPLGIAGAYEQGLAMTGGNRSEVSATRGVHDSFAPSLLNEPAGLADWTREDIATFLHIGRAEGRGSATGAMAEVIEKSTQYLNEADRLAIADYLLSLKSGAGSPGRAVPATAAPAAMLAAGRTIYARDCASCHGAEGEGRGLAYAALAKSSAVNARDPSSLIYVILYGAQAPATESNRWAQPMPGYQAALTDAEIAQLLTFLRQSWGNVGGAVSPEQVAGIRQKTALLKPETGTGNINPKRQAPPPGKRP